MSLFNLLNEKKKQGEKLVFEELTAGDLKKLFEDENKTDNMVAELFDCSAHKVINYRSKIEEKLDQVEELLQGKTKRAKEDNQVMKKTKFNKDNLNNIVNAITHFSFRCGPVEDMHASQKNLTNADMETLNKFMMNKLAYVFLLVVEERWIEFDILVKEMNSLYGSQWYEAIPDPGFMTKRLELVKEEINGKYLA